MKFSCEDLLVRHLVLKHLGIDSGTLLEQNRATLESTDCSPVDHPTTNSNCGARRWLCIARLKCKTSFNMDEEKEITAFREMKKYNRPRGNYIFHKLDVHPFPDSTLFSAEESNSEEKEKTDITSMLKRGKQNGFPTWQWPQSEFIIWKFANTFSTRFSSTPTRVEPLKIELTAEAGPLRVRHRYYSIDKRVFLQSLMKDLEEPKLMYANYSQIGHAHHLLCLELDHLNGDSPFTYVQSTDLLLRINFRCHASRLNWLKLPVPVSMEINTSHTGTGSVHYILSRRSANHSSFLTTYIHQRVFYMVEKKLSYMYSRFWQWSNRTCWNHVSYPVWANSYSMNEQWKRYWTTLAGFYSSAYVIIGIYILESAFYTQPLRAFMGE